MVNLLQRLLFGPTGGAASLAAAGGRPIGTDLISPWQDSSTLAKIAYSELFTGSGDVVDRNVAMTVAPVKRGRAIIVGSVADLPLVAGRFGDPDPADPEDSGFAPIARQPAWLTSTRTIVTPWHRMANTLDDLIFHGWSLWALERSEAGTITDALRVPRSSWDFDDTSPTGVKVNGVDVTDPRSVMLFQGPDEGLLATASDVIRGARAIERSWVGRVRNPIPLTVLHEIERNGVSEGEAIAQVEAYSAARRSEDGAVAWLPSTINLETYGETEPSLFTEGRNNVRLDIANHLNLPASLLDGSTATASLTYVTQEGERTSLIDYLEYWLAPIEARLSMDDITPRGQVIRFARGNLTDVPNSPYGPQAVTPEPDPNEEIAA